MANILPRRPNGGRQEGVVKDGGNGRHTLVYKTQGEKKLSVRRRRAVTKGRADNRQILGSNPISST